MLGDLLATRLVRLTTAYWRAGYYPKAFRKARTIVLPKDKEDMSEPGAYRPIALLNTMGKVIEGILAKRIAHEAEALRLLPEEQMGNRENRSTEAAIQTIVD